MDEQCNVRHKWWFLSGALIVATSMCAWAMVLLWHAWHLGVGTLAQPSPGFFPMGLGVGVLLCGLGLLWQNMQQTGDLPIPTSFVKRGVLSTVIGVMGFASTAPMLGWVIATACCTLASTVLDRRWKWSHRLLYATGCGLLAWLVFDFGLGIPLPAWQQPW